MCFSISCSLRIIGPSYRGVWLCIAGFWDLQTTSFEIPWFLGFDDFDDDDDGDGDGDGDGDNDDEEEDDNNDDADSDHDMILVILSFSNYPPKV